MMNKNISRKQGFNEKIVFIDGLPGCGKTLFSKLVSSFDRVEKLNYAYEIENLCQLKYFEKISTDAISAMIRFSKDLMLYNSMMSREVNFRPSDLSSIFHHHNTLKYIKRAFEKGDFAVPSKIKKEKPILPLTVHNLLCISDPIFEALGDDAVFIEIVRHPLYMIIQQTLNFEKLVYTARDFSLYIEHNNNEIPWYTNGWEDLFVNSNPVEKAIYFIEKIGEQMKNARIRLREKYNANILTISFENFVLEPDSYMLQIESITCSKITNITKRELKKQNVPRVKIADGISLDVYKRCGWTPPVKGLSEKEELNLRREFVKKSASSESIIVLENLCKEYEENYLQKFI